MRSAPRTFPFYIFAIKNRLKFRYLGKPINTESSEVDCRRPFEEKLHPLLQALDTDTLTASAKIWPYHQFVASKLSCSLLIKHLCFNILCQKAVSHCHQNTQAVCRASEVRQLVSSLCCWPRSVWCEGPQSHHTLEAATAHQAQPAHIPLERALQTHR